MFYLNKGRKNFMLEGIKKSLFIWQEKYDIFPFFMMPIFFSSDDLLINKM